MEQNQIIELFNSSLNSLYENDLYLLTNDLSEQAISHKLAEHLQNLFSTHNFIVDCEYNGGINNEGNRKHIRILKEKLQSLGLLKENEQTNLDIEFVERMVYPDIIIHHRGTNNYNLCAIEVKKTTNQMSHEYDFVKLGCYTQNNYGDLGYQLGVFLLIKTGIALPSFEVRYFKNGQEVKPSDFN